jgi:hypothetical protein
MFDGRRLIAKAAIEVCGCGIETARKREGRMKKAKVQNTMLKKRRLETDETAQTAFFSVSDGQSKAKPLFHLNPSECLASVEALLSVEEVTRYEMASDQKAATRMASHHSRSQLSRRGHD